MEEIGKLIKKLPIESGAKKDGSGDWSKMSFVIQVKDSKYPTEICFDTFNSELIQFISDTSLDTVIKVAFSIKSREYNGRYFTGATAYSAEVVRDMGNEEVRVPKNEWNDIKKDALQPVEDDQLPF